jgi:hypothetical protein
MPKENLERKSKEEVEAWVEDKKTKKGDKLVIADENTGFASVNRLKKEVQKL